MSTKEFTTSQALFNQMKKVTGTMYYKHGSLEIHEIEHKGVLLWQSKMISVIGSLIDKGKPINMDYVLSSSFDKEICDLFSKADLVKLLETSPKSRTPLTYVKILSELMIRFSEKESSIRHFLSKQDLEDLGTCLEILLQGEKFETACYVRDEINKRATEIN
jgi:hypothetical protein